MKVPAFLFMSIVVSVIISCSENTNAESEKIGYKTITHVDVVDDLPPPPPNLTPKFKNLQHWLLSICEDERPKNPIGIYNLGILESPEDQFIYLVGINKYDKGDTSYTHIEFEPSNLYFQLPKSEYRNLGRDQLVNKITVQLKEFTNTEKFKTSFLAETDSIVFESTGQTIWSR